MNMKGLITFATHLAATLCLGLPELPAGGAEIAVEGVTVTPHVQSAEMRYRQEPDRSLGARVQVFLRNTAGQPLSLGPETLVLVRGKTPEQLLAADEWAWHDFPSAWSNAPLTLPPDGLTVWSFNGKRAPWGVGTTANLEVRDTSRAELAVAPLRFDPPKAWLSAVTFLGEEPDPFPHGLIFHVANEHAVALRLEACRLWLPQTNTTWRALQPGPWHTNLTTFPVTGRIPPGDRGGARVATGKLPLTYTAFEVRLRDPEDRLISLWAHLRIRREWFDLSGGWVHSAIEGRSTLRFEPYLKTLKRMHLNTAHIAHVDGYTDKPELYERYPLKYFNRLSPAEGFDADPWLPRIHAVEFLGEPQYGGGRPVPPMEVWQALAPYQSSRLPTTVTHSEERIWRFYAGLSDFPHYDAYRVSAPAADAWNLYDRWNGQRVRWGAPLETIGEMTRSLRELNRPNAIAYWSQGAHHGWDVYGGRRRTSPTPDELRVQAWQALAARITSLYWFNLSLRSLLKFPDLIEPMTRVGREIRMLDRFFVEGDAYGHARVADPAHGRPAWETSVVASPVAAVCVVTDLAYTADPAERVFKFGAPREAELVFRLPQYLRSPVEVLRVDADGVHSVPFRATPEGISVRDEFGPVTIFVASVRAGLGRELEARRERLVAAEVELDFDPGNNPQDLEVLRSLAEKKRP